jgi:hypothetical protein
MERIPRYYIRSDFQTPIPVIVPKLVEAWLNG